MELWSKELSSHPWCVRACRGIWRAWLGYLLTGRFPFTLSMLSWMLQMVGEVVVSLGKAADFGEGRDCWLSAAKIKVAILVAFGLEGEDEHVGHEEMCSSKAAGMLRAGGVDYPGSRRGSARRVRCARSISRMVVRYSSSFHGRSRPSSWRSISAASSSDKIEEGSVPGGTVAAF